MNAVAILGAGELGATLARLLMDREAARRIVLIDADESRAQGKALDLRQAGPVEGSDAIVEGRAKLQGLGGCDALVIADPPELADPKPLPLRLADFARALQPRLGEAPLVVAQAAPAGLVHAFVDAGVPWTRVLGSAPIAWSSAMRRLLALELGVAAREVVATVVGLPPDLVTVGVSAGGLTADALPARALFRAGERLRARSFGPVALARAALSALHALEHMPPSSLPVVAAPSGGAALGVPARIGGGRIVELPELPLDPRTKVAFENAAARR
jgi:malate dehydrogenase